MAENYWRTLAVNHWRSLALNSWRIVGVFHWRIIVRKLTSGTVGASCLQLGRQFILVDINPEAMEVMAKRFNKKIEIEWVNFKPTELE